MNVSHVYMNTRTRMYFLCREKAHHWQHSFFQSCYRHMEWNETQGHTARARGPSVMHTCPTLVSLCSAKNLRTLLEIRKSRRDTLSASDPSQWKFRVSDHETSSNMYKGHPDMYKGHPDMYKGHPTSTKGTPTCTPTCTKGTSTCTKGTLHVRRAPDVYKGQTRQRSYHIA